MDENQKASLLQAIAISSATSPRLSPLITPQSRIEAFNTLEQFKQFSGRMGMALTLLRTDQHTVPVLNSGQVVDITAPTKLYVLGIIDQFLKKEYSKLKNETDRLAIRAAIMTAAQQLLAHSSSVVVAGGTQNESDDKGMGADEMRYLAVKIAALIANVAIRDFPQRWETFITDIFQPLDQGGLWYAQPYDPSPETIPIVCGSHCYGPTIGIKIVLECLSRIVEDCTDGDFNAKVSTRRRSDILIGLNEVRRQFLPLIFDFLSQQYTVLSATKNTLNEMQNYLVSCGRVMVQMTAEERVIYEQQIRKRDGTARRLGDCLETIEKCCRSMPTDWILGDDTTAGAINGPPTVGAQNATSSERDFLVALLHLLREDTLQLQVQAVTCLQLLVSRKLEHQPWLRLMSKLPQAVSDAHDAVSNQDALEGAANGKSTVDPTTRLVKNLAFHRKLSKLLSLLASTNLSHISTDEDICSSRGENFKILTAHLNLMAEMLSHPSPRVCGEQISAWIAMLRDPHIAKTSSRLLQPFLERVLSCIVDRRAKVRWDDVANRTHPHALIFEESWEDKDEFDSWLMDFRSRASQAFKLISAVAPKLAATIIQAKAQSLFSLYGSCEGGRGRDYVDAVTGQLTQRSTAVMELEGLSQPLDTVLQGLPQWALDNSKQSDPSYMEPHRVETRNAVRSSLAEVANMIVSWDPSDNWLKFRRATLLDALKYYWRYDQTTLPTGVDALLTYLGAESPSISESSTSPSKFLNDDIISLRKKSGTALISVSKRVPHLLVGWLGQMSARAKTLLSSQTLLPTNKMHLIEFLSCVATAVQDPVSRSNFVHDVLSEDLMILELQLIKDALASPEGMLTFMGIAQVASNPSVVTDKEFVKQTTSNYVKLFSAFNHLLSVGKRCHEAARKRPNGGIPMQESALFASYNPQSDVSSQIFPDEGAVCLKDLEFNDPFVPLWPRILPSLIRVLDVLFTLWHPQYQGNLLKNAIQRYAYAISDDEAYLAKNQGSLSGGGVFGEGGTAGSVVSGWDRRGNNLAPKWSGWFNELRNTCLQLLGLLAIQRALFAPELASMYPEFVKVVASPVHLQTMEHRHISQYIKQFLDLTLLSCPSTLYESHLVPILAPFFQHLNYRLRCTWKPIQETTTISTKPLATPDCVSLSDIASHGGDEWFISYYARGGLFVGDVDAVIGEAVVEKVRVDLSRCFSDMLQTALALKGDWALVLANQAKEDQALKRNDASRLESVPSTKTKKTSGPVNADGTPRSTYHLAIEARKNLRIRSLCHFLLLGHENIAGFLVLNVIECLAYPDAYTSRRCTRICHRILETVAWSDRYTRILGEQMFLTAVKAVVSEPKWMVGLELEMINLIRNIYCRLVLGQTLLPGGQGPGMQHVQDSTTSHFEQSKTVENPLLGGGILCVKSDLPREVLSGLPGINPQIVIELEQSLSQKLAAKDQKDSLCDLLRIAAENLKESESGSYDQFGVLGRATASESLLNQTIRQKADAVPALPEKLVTHSMVMKQKEGENNISIPNLGEIFKLT